MALVYREGFTSTLTSELTAEAQYMSLADTTQLQVLLPQGSEDHTYLTLHDGVNRETVRVVSVGGLTCTIQRIKEPVKFPAGACVSFEATMDVLMEYILQEWAGPNRTAIITEGNVNTSTGEVVTTESHEHEPLEDLGNTSLDLKVQVSDRGNEGLVTVQSLATLLASHLSNSSSAATGVQEVLRGVGTSITGDADRPVVGLEPLHTGFDDNRLLIDRYGRVRGYTPGDTDNNFTDGVHYPAQVSVTNGSITDVSGADLPNLITQLVVEPSQYLELVAISNSYKKLQMRPRPLAGQTVNGFVFDSLGFPVGYDPATAKGTDSEQGDTTGEGDTDSPIDNIEWSATAAFIIKHSGSTSQPTRRDVGDYSLTQGSDRNLYVRVDANDDRLFHVTFTNIPSDMNSNYNATVCLDAGEIQPNIGRTACGSSGYKGGRTFNGRCATILNPTKNGFSFKPYSYARNGQSYKCSSGTDNTSTGGIDVFHWDFSDRTVTITVDR